jgi:hypothetical protein
MVKRIEVYIASFLSNMVFIHSKSVNIFDYQIDQNFLIYKIKSKLHCFACIKYMYSLGNGLKLKNMSIIGKKVQIFNVFHINSLTDYSFISFFSQTPQIAQDFISNFISNLNTTVNVNFEILKGSELERSFFVFLETNKNQEYEVKLQPFSIWQKDNSRLFYLYNFIIEYSKIKQDNIEDLSRYLQTSNVHLYFLISKKIHDIFSINCLGIFESKDKIENLTDFLKAIKIDQFFRFKSLTLSDFKAVIRKKPISNIRFASGQFIDHIIHFTTETKKEDNPKTDLIKNPSKNDPINAIEAVINKWKFKQIESDLYFLEDLKCTILIMQNLQTEKLQKLLEQYYSQSSIMIMIIKQDTKELLTSNTKILKLKKIKLILDAELDSIDKLLIKLSSSMVNPDNLISAESIVDMGFQQ